MEEITLNHTLTKITKSVFVANAGWKLLESFSSKGVSFLVMLVLVRLLSPSDYGIIALTTVFVGLADILIQAGFATALIRQKEVDEGDYSAVLFFSLAVALVLYAIVFFAAPFIASYFEATLLSAVLRVLCLMFFLQALAAVRTAIVTRFMQFRFLCLANLIGGVVAGCASIALALNGWGVWALVFQQLFQQVILNCILFAKVKWHPTLSFHFSTIRKYASFSSMVLASSLISYFGDSIFDLIIGKKFSSSSLGYYNTGNQVPRQVSLYTFGALSSTMLPMLASYQDDTEKLRSVVGKLFGMTGYIVLPLMAGLFIVSQPLVLLLFGEKWLPAVPLFKYACIYYTAVPLILVLVQLMFALGKAKTRVFVESFRLALLAALLVISLMVFPGNIISLVSGRALAEFLILVLCLVLTNRLIGYGFKNALADLAPSFVPTFSATLAMLILSFLPIAPIFALLLQIAAGSSLFVLVSARQKNKYYFELKQYIMHRFRRTGKND